MKFYQKILFFFLLPIVMISCSDDDSDLDPGPEQEIQKRVTFVDGPQATFDYKYNADNRLSQIVLDWDSEETETIQFTYDPNGRLVSVERGTDITDPSNVATYEYNGDFPKVVETYTYLGTPYSEVHEYSVGKSRTYHVEQSLFDENVDHPI